jgi:hypothetical protein
MSCPLFSTCTCCHGHLLLAAASVALEHFHLGRERARQLRRHRHGGFLKLRSSPIGDLPHAFHGSPVHDRHLGAKHSLELIARAEAFDDRRREFNAVAAKTIRLDELGVSGLMKPRSVMPNDSISDMNCT